MIWRVCTLTFCTCFTPKQSYRCVYVHNSRTWSRNRTHWSLAIIIGESTPYCCRRVNISSWTQSTLQQYNKLIDCDQRVVNTARFDTEDRLPTIDWYLVRHLLLGHLNVISALKKNRVIPNRDPISALNRRNMQYEVNYLWIV